MYAVFVGGGWFWGGLYVYGVFSCECVMFSVCVCVYSSAHDKYPSVADHHHSCASHADHIVRCSSPPPPHTLLDIVQQRSGRSIGIGRNRCGCCCCCLRRCWWWCSLCCGSGGNTLVGPLQIDEHAEDDRNDADQVQIPVGEHVIVDLQPSVADAEQIELLGGWDDGMRCNVFRIPNNVL